MQAVICESVRMKDFAQLIFTRMGWNTGDADIAAQHLVMADLSGHASHGVGMVPRYIQAMNDGFLKPSNRPVETLRSGSFLVIQGNTALGQAAAHDATAQAAAIAKAQGVAIVNLINAHHIGRIGHYAEMAAADGLIGLFWVNVSGSEALVVPWGGIKPRYSTNPHAIGIPRAGGQPFLLDFATSRLAHGKTRVAHLAGKKVPFGAVVDVHGQPSDDPAVVWTEPMGGLAPFGEHKGYGMALACEILSSVFGGGDTIAESRNRRIIHNSMLAILIDPARLGADQSAWQAKIETYLAWVQSAGHGGESAVRVPGDPEFAARAASGGMVRYEAGNWAAIAAAAQSIGVTQRELPAVQ